MNQIELMAAGALAASLLALFFSAVAAWPTLKPYLEEVRDLVLWAALAVVAIGGGWIAWQQTQKPGEPVANPPSPGLEPRESSMVQWPKE